MIDIHSHILYGIDDGSKSIEESINILNKAIDNGYTVAWASDVSEDGFTGVGIAVVPDVTKT